MGYLVLAITIAVGQPVSDVKLDEEVLFFDTFGYVDRERDAWVIPRHSITSRSHRRKGDRRQKVGSALADHAETSA